MDVAFEDVDFDKAIERTADLFGGRATLRRVVRNGFEAHDLLREGLPSPALRHLVGRAALLRSHPDTFEKAIGMSLRTYQRRREAVDEPLNREQSGRAWKFAEILARVIALLGAQSEAEAWLEQPAPALDGRKPIDLLSTPAGIESVETLLGRLEYGVYT